MSQKRQFTYMYFVKVKLKKELREIKVFTRQESQISDIRSISERPKEVLSYLRLGKEI